MSEEPNYKIGDRIILKQKQKVLLGTIRYIGEVEEKQGIYYGIELDLKEGNHNGTVKGKQYFVCEEQKGVLTKASLLQPYDPQVYQDLVDQAQNQQLLMKQQTQIEESEQSQQLLQRQQSTPIYLEEQLTKNQSAQDSVQQQSQIQDQAENQQIKQKTKTPATTQQQDPLIKKAQTAQSTFKKLIQKNQQQQQQSSGQFLQKQNSQAILNEEILDLRNLIDLKDEEIEKLREQNYQQSEEKEILYKDQESLNQQIQSLDSQIVNFQEIIKQQNQQNENLRQEILLNNNIIEGKDKQIADLQNQLQDSNNHSTQLDNQIQEMKQKLDDMRKEVEDSNEAAELLTLENEDKIQKIEAFKIQLEHYKQKVDQLDMEKDLANKELEEYVHGNLGGPISGQDPELIKKVAQFKQAVQILNKKLEEQEKKLEDEKINSLEKILELEGQIDELLNLKVVIEEKNKEIENLNQKIINKDQELEELRQQLDEAQDSIRICELLTEEKLKQEEKIAELTREMKQMQENQKLDAEYILELEDKDHHNQKQFIKMEYEICDFKQKLEEKENAIIELNNAGTKLREKISLMKSQISSLQEEYQTALSGQQQNNNLRRLHELMEQTYLLHQEKREIFKSYLVQQVINIEIRNENVLKSDLIKEAVTPMILKRLHLDGIILISKIAKTKEKCHLCFNEFLTILDTERFVKEQNAINNDGNSGGEGSAVDGEQPTPQNGLQNWILSFLHKSSELFYFTSRSEIIIQKTEDENHLRELHKSNYINMLMHGGLFLDQIIKQLQEDTLTHAIKLEQFDIILQKLRDIQLNEEMVFSECELAKSIQQTTIEFSRMIYILKQSTPEAVVDTLFKTFQKYLKSLEQAIFEGFIISEEKIKAVADILLEVQNETIGFEDDSLKEFLTYSAPSTSQQDPTLPPAEQQQQSDGQSTQQQKSSEALVMVGSNEDLTQNQEIKIKRKKFRSVVSSATNLIDALLKELPSEAPPKDISSLKFWKNKAHQVQQELEEIQKVIENERKLKVELTEQHKQNIILETENQQMQVANKTLEQRIIDLQTKCNRVNILEQEKQRLQEREKHYKSSTDTLCDELDKNRKKCKQLEEELHFLKTMQQSQRSINSIISQQIIQPNQQQQQQQQQIQKSNSNILPTNSTANANQSSIQEFIPSDLDMDQRTALDIGENIVEVLMKENSILRHRQLGQKIANLNHSSPNLSLLQQLLKKKQNLSLQKEGIQGAGENSQDQQLSEPNSAISSSAAESVSNARATIVSKDEEGRQGFYGNDNIPQIVNRTFKVLSNLHQQTLNNMASQKVVNISELNKEKGRLDSRNKQILEETYFDRNRSVACIQFEAYNAFNEFTKNLQLKGDGALKKNVQQIQEKAKTLVKIATLHLGESQQASAKPPLQLVITKQEWQKIKLCL